MAQPYSDASSHLRDELRRVWLRVEYEIRRGWGRGQVDGAEDEDHVWRPADLGKLFSNAQNEWARSGEDESGAQQILERWLEFGRQVDERTAATFAANIRIPLLELARQFQLTRRQWAALTFALMPEVDPNLVHAYRYLARDVTCRGLDGRLLAQLVYDTPESRALLARDLSPAAPLMFYRLLETSSSAGQHDSLLFRRIRPATRLVHMLDGARVGVDPELAELVVYRAGEVHGVFPQAVIDHAAAALRANDVLLAVQGQRGVGKRLLLQMAAARWGKGLLLIDGKRIANEPFPVQQAMVRAILRDARLLDAIPVVPDIDDTLALDGAELPSFAASLMAEWNGPFAITINRERMPRLHSRPLVHLAVAVPPAQTRTQLWQRAVPALDDPDAHRLSERFAIPGGVIAAAAQAAEAQRLPDDPPPDLQMLTRAVGEQLHQRIQRLGKRLETPHDMGDLVVDDDVRDALVEIVAAVKERRTVREQWGLRGAHGISVLFSGHPGVGKTMSATVLARRLGLDIYEVDLSQVVSKWLGESEKNLSDLFDAAEPGHVVLLFNEADSLFGKRTADVKSSNDRYANLETNYLLQRLERFGGLALLTTNLTSAIDSAFKRRFTYDVFFSFPSPEMRVELWERTLPRKARAADIDFVALAEKYELSGGFIKVACERAAYLANAAGTQITNELLRHTIERMYRERGKLSAVGPLE
ncbi:MAG TPA: ATP-binding protein [Kofleriaceae bacterium]|nr:ATP-binding protein [Kofleriaceae bacterium]